MYGSIENEPQQTNVGQQERSDQQHQQQQQPQLKGPQSNRNTTSRGFSSTGSSQSADIDRIYTHCHVQSGENDDSLGAGKVDASARRRLILASVVCLIFMVAEIVGGILSNSLAIATDAAHLLTDFASFLISLFALWLGSRPASKKMSFGWYRAEVIGALVSVLMIWLITGLLVYIAIERLITNEIEIDPTIMLITAAAGLLVNIIMACTLHSHGHHHHGHGHSHHDHVNDDEPSCGSVDHQTIIKNSSESINLLIDTGSDHDKTNPDLEKREHDNNIQWPNNAKAPIANGQSPPHDNHHRPVKHRKQENINIRAAFIHVLGDFIQSLGVLIAAAVIYFYPDYAIIDPICTFFFSVIVLLTTLNVVRDAINVLMEGIPNGVNFHEVMAKLTEQKGVIKVHNLRIWSLTMDKIALSTHIVIDTNQVSQSEALDSANDMLKRTYGFMEITIQVEEFRDDMRDCTHCQEGQPQFVIGG